MLLFFISKEINIFLVILYKANKNSNILFVENSTKNQKKIDFLPNFYLVAQFYGGGTKLEKCSCLKLKKVQV